MAAVTLHLEQRGNGRFKPRQKRGDVDVSEIIRRQRREELKPDIGRGGAVRDGLATILLEVVGDQPMVRGSDEIVEEPPRLPRDSAK
jgi:hypothetical protein